MVEEQGYFLLKRADGKIEYYPAFLETGYDKNHNYQYCYVKTVKPIHVNNGDTVSLYTSWKSNKEFEISASQKYSAPDIEYSLNNKQNGVGNTQKENTETTGN